MTTIKQMIADLQDSPQPSIAGSIYMPTHPQSNAPNVTADKTRFKNALQYIRSNADYDESLLAGSMQKLDELYEDMEFWKHQDRSLAVLFSPDRVDCIKLPIEVSEQTYMTNRFVLSPLRMIDAISTDFYVLDINTTMPRLLQSTDGALEVVNEDGMPGSFEDEVGKDEYQKQLQSQPGGPGSFHGHGEEDVVDDETRRYFKLIASAVDTFLADETAPLLLSGTVDRIAAVRKDMHYGHVIDDGHEGASEHLNTHELYVVTQPLVQDHRLGQLTDAVERISSTSPEFVAVGNDEIVEVATKEPGRIERLFLPAYRITKDTVQPGDDDSLVVELPAESAATESLVAAVTAQGGDVIPVQIDTYDFIDQPKALCRY